jgi:hypothetical protein
VLGVHSRFVSYPASLSVGERKVDTKQIYEENEKYSR